MTVLSLMGFVVVVKGNGCPYCPMFFPSLFLSRGVLGVPITGDLIFKLFGPAFINHQKRTVRRNRPRHRILVEMNGELYMLFI